MCNDIAQVWCEVTALPCIEYSYYVALGSLRTELITVVFAYVVCSKRIQSNVYISTLYYLHIYNFTLYHILILCQNQILSPWLMHRDRQNPPFATIQYQKSYCFRVVVE